MIFHLVKHSFAQNPNGIFLLVFIWTAFEYLHLDWDLSWPWLNLGNAFAMYTKWVQWYEFTGIFGGTIWVLLMNIFIFHILKNTLNRAPKPNLIFNAMMASLIFLVPMIISIAIYLNYEEKGPLAEIIVTQPNFDPYSEQYTLPASKIIERNLQQAESLISDTTDFVVCPESAIQEDIWHHSIERSPSVLQVRSFIEKHPNTSVMIGASTFRMFEEEEPLTRTARKFRDVEKYYEAFNTALYFSKDREVGIYHKSKLVPGPEKMPFQQLLSPLQRFAFDLGGTVGSLGYSENREVFAGADGQFLVPPIICYESIYGEFVNGFVKNGANILLIITNDGWWGNTAGHRQHFAFAKLRALETRRSLARSANTGISTFVDQRGDVIQQTDYWVPDVIKASLHANDKITFYVALGDFLGRITTLVAVLVILIAFAGSLIKKPSM
jgi:apolipoprotein N-acyltransferase